MFSVFPVVVLLIFALLARGADQPGERWRLWAVGSGVALLLAICGILTGHYRAHLSYRVQLARAEVWVEPAEAWIQPLVETVSQEVQPGERIFVYGHEAQLYFLTGRFYPWPYSQLYPGQEGGDGGLMLSVLLKRVPPKLVLRGVLKWPGVPDLSEYAPTLFYYIMSTFETDKNFFVEHPISGGEAPPHWVISVLRPIAEEPSAR